MEHRYSIRKNVAMRILVFNNCHQITLGRATDASHHGMFLECETDNFRKNQSLKIEMLTIGRRPRSVDHFKCFVVRIAKNGVGLAIFDEHQSDYAMAIDSLLKRYDSVISYDSNDKGEEASLPTKEYGSYRR